MTKPKIEHRYAEVANSTVLDADKHRTLINDIDFLCQRARVPMWAVCRPLAASCTAEEVEWVRHFRQHQLDRDGGLVLTGNSPDAVVRISAIAGALIRNFIDARVVSVHQVIKALSQDDMPDPTVLLIPNFHVSREDGGHISEWERAPLLGLLMERHSLGRQCVLYVQSMGGLRKDYGTAIYQHLQNYFTEIRIGA